MPPDPLNTKLVDASKLFTNRNYADALRLLNSASRDDPKVTHNVAVLEYLQNMTDCRAAVQALEEVPGSAAPTDAGPPLLNGGSLPKVPATGLSLAYEGNEIAHYNRAVILIHNSFVEEGMSILRELLEMGSGIATAVLGRAACLFYVSAVRSAPIRQNQARAKSDEALFQQVMAQHGAELKKEPILARMVALATADQAGLHDNFKVSIGAEKAVCFNDIGILALEDAKPHVAAVYFALAVKEAASDASLFHLQQSISYNAGICALARGEHEAALAALLATADTLKGSPLLWLRVAQACVGILQQLSADTSQEVYEAEQTRIAQRLSKGGAASTISPGFQLLQVPCGSSIYRASVASQPSGPPIVALALGAVEAVLNILIAPSSASSSSSSSSSSPSTASALAESVHQYHASGCTQHFRTLQLALAYLCYIETLRQNFSLVYKIGCDLLAVHKAHALKPDVHVTVVSLMTEALCHLNKPALALKVLQAASLQDFVNLSAVGDKTEAARQKQRVEALFVNVAVIHIAAGSWKQAQTIITSLLSKVAAGTAAQPVVTIAPPFSTAKLAALLQVFLELAQGNKDKALELLGRGPSRP